MRLRLSFPASGTWTTEIDKADFSSLFSVVQYLSEQRSVREKDLEVIILESHPAMVLSPFI